MCAGARAGSACRHAQGQEAIQFLQLGVIDELSIGFDTAEFEMRESADGEKIRLITRLRPEETRILSQYENQLETALGRWARLVPPAQHEGFT